jgi:hypothetical protein
MTASNSPNLAVLLQFIQNFEQANPGQSPYVMANRLRGYTKPAYTTRSWTLVTGYEQRFIDSTLDREVVWGGAATDFGHLIAALADQIQAPGVHWSSLTRWTADDTSWAGDIGSAIVAFRKSAAVSLADRLSLLASDADYTADVAAWLAGQMIAKGSTLSGALGQLSGIPARDQARQFLQGRLGGMLSDNRLTNPALVEATIRRRVFVYLELSPDSGLLQWLGSRLKIMPKADTGAGRSDLLQGALHFLHFLVRQGNIEPLIFQPYQIAQTPWLSLAELTVSASWVGVGELLP